MHLMIWTSRRARDRQLGRELLFAIAFCQPVLLQERLLKDPTSFGSLQPLHTPRPKKKKPTRNLQLPDQMDTRNFYLGKEATKPSYIVSYLRY